MDALRRVIIERRDPLRRALVAGGVAVPLLFAAGALLVDGWEAQRFLLLYVAPFFIAFFAWAWIRVGRIETDRPGALAVDAVATLLGAVRFSALTGLPFSGHMLFFTYAALTVRSTRFLLLVLLLTAETTWFKLVLWRDPRSWALGIATGAALAAARILLNRTSTVPSATP